MKDYTVDVGVCKYCFKGVQSIHRTRYSSRQKNRVSFVIYCPLKCQASEEAMKIYYERRQKGLSEKECIKGL